MSSGALIIFALFMLWLLVGDTKRRPDASPALWLVVAWMTLAGSRPVSAWFDSVSADSTAEAYDEGNPFERVVYIVLIVCALAVLSRRKLRLSDVLRCNPWLMVFFLYWGLSILWADAPFVAFKRWFKDVGNLVMVMIVLSETHPVAAMKAVMMRTACVLVPTSVLFIRFIPELGRTFHIGTGEMMYIGVSTHKNSLGVLALVCLLFLAWSALSKAGTGESARSLRWTLCDLTMAAMAGWLLYMSGSATALGCAALGLAVLALFQLESWRRHALFIEMVAIVVGLIVWIGVGTEGAMELIVVDMLNRDLTLTTRTDVWPMLLSKTDSVMFGSGFSSFWTGERLAEIYNKLGIIQAHNGYLETYLNGGLCALGLLFMVLFSAILAINRQFAAGVPHASLALSFVLVSIAYNATEASFDKNSLLWFGFLLMVAKYRKVVSPDEERPRHPDRMTGPRNSLFTAQPGSSAFSLGRNKP